MTKIKAQILILFIIFNLNIYSQKINIEYSVTENTNDAILANTTNYNLFIENNKSIYFNNQKDSLNQFKYKQNIFDVSQIGDVKRVKLSDNHYAYVKHDFFYKDYVKDTLLYNEIIASKKFIIGEKINLFNWELKPKSDTLILGFKCQKATTKFRGRVYDAFYSSDIAPFGGPWKFDGLPGLILYIKSKDNYFVIEPLKVVKNSKENVKVDDIYMKEKIISWGAYKKSFEVFLKKQLQNLKSMSENGEGGSIKITDKIEDLEIPEMKY